MPFMQTVAGRTVPNHGTLSTALRVLEAVPQPTRVAELGSTGGEPGRTGNNNPNEPDETEGEQMCDSLPVSAAPLTGEGSDELPAVGGRPGHTDGDMVAATLPVRNLGKRRLLGHIPPCRSVRP